MLGSMNTPTYHYCLDEPLVDHLLDLAQYAPGKGIADRILLDVAIGFGVFLADAARRLIRELRLAGSDSDLGTRPVVYAQSVHRYAFDFPPRGRKPPRPAAQYECLPLLHHEPVALSPAATLYE
jgi:hypothetical protein